MPGIEAQSKAEVAELMAKAEAADQADVPDSLSILDERPAREQADYEDEFAARGAKAKATGEKLGGRPPTPPSEGPSPNDQVNFTDEDSRIMPVAGGGFEQCHDAQAVVATGGMLGGTPPVSSGAE